MKKMLSGVLTVLFMFVFVLSPLAAQNDINGTIYNVSTYLLAAVPNPSVGSVGGEWAVFGLKRSGLDINDAYFEQYFQNVRAYIAECGGILSDRKYTEYARVSIALTAIGKNPENVDGVNLLKPLGDFNKTVKQGINGAIFALIALDCGNYEMPINENAEVQATREMYVDFILNNELSGGGWAFFGDAAEPDITAMALQALSCYRSDTRVKDAAERAVEKLSEMQNENGGYLYGGEENAESAAQVAVALSSLNIPVSDARFVKNGCTLIDNLLSFYVSGSGFKHVKSGEVNQMATEQCFYALVAANRFEKGESALYRITDVRKNTASLAKDVNPLQVIFEDKTFDDISGHEYENSIESLARCGVINGVSETEFSPDSCVTRAEFAAIFVRALGLETQGANVFSDISASDWFVKDVGTAYRYGIIKGVSETEFNPNGFVSREQAAVQIYRVLTALNIGNLNGETAENTVDCSDWAKDAISFLMQNEIMPTKENEIRPYDNATRGEIADLLYRTIQRANLFTSVGGSR